MADDTPNGFLARRKLLLGATAIAVSTLAAACGGGSGATNTPKAAPTTTLTPIPAATASTNAPTAAATSASITAAPAATATAALATPSPSTAAVPPTPSPSSSTLTASAPAAMNAANVPLMPVEPGDLIKDAAGHFTFIGPKGWTANPDPISPTVAQLSAQNPTRGMRVLESSPTEGKSLQQYAKDSLATLKTNGSFRAGTREQQPTTLGGEPAVLDDYTTPANSVLGYVVRVLCIRGGLLYSVFFSTEPQAADALQPVVKLVLDSWKFL